MKKSARRQSYVARKKAQAIEKNKQNRKNFPISRILIPLGILLAIFLFIKGSTRVWNGKDKVSFVYRENDGSVGVTVLDPILSEVTTLVIPGDTQVEVARNYGTFRIKNVWQLGINERIGGSLLAETVTQNFLFPVYLWSEDGAGLIGGNILGVLNFVFFPGSTNISFGDRLQAGLFILRIQEIGKSTVDLGTSRFLDKGILADGQPGYILSGPISQRLTIYFSDNQLGNQNIKVNITDATGSSGISEKLGEILQVIGGKVVSIEKKNTSPETDCLVSGKNAEVVKKISNLFDCKIVNTKTSFDLDIEIGKKFAERF